MKFLLTLVLTVCWLKLSAQEALAPRQVYTDSKARFRVSYPQAWQRQRSEDRSQVAFFAGSARQHPVVTLTVRPAGPGAASLLGRQDSLWRRIQQLSRAQILRLEQHEATGYAEVSYHYTFAPDLASADRTRVLGRRLWRNGTEFDLEYRAADEDGRYLSEAEQLVESFDFAEPATPAPPLPTAARCDNKMYGIAALRLRNDLWEDDCRTIHEFAADDLSAPPRIHRNALPFQSYALAKGFDNCLYSVTKAPTDAPEYVYRYNPATHQGEYTSWQLPAQGPETVWISGATDEQGNLYFSTADANKLVKIDPADGTVTELWDSDPLRKAAYFPRIGFAGAGSHGNFCLDDTGTLFQVYSTDGSLLNVDLKTRQPGPEPIALQGLPKRGGYSDLLLQKDEQGNRRLYLAGPKALYEVDMVRRRVRLVRRGTYTDLAGCNLFGPVPAKSAPAAAVAPAAAPTLAIWRGRVLNGVTFQPLPQAQLRLRRPDGGEIKVPLTPQGTFTITAEPGLAYATTIQLPGYLALDSTYTPPAGPYVQDLLLYPLAVGSTLPLDNVQFTQGQAVLLPSSFPTLDQLVGMLTKNPTMTIELRGHTDNQGDPQKNVVLSQERVAAVKAYLVEHGVGAPRITGIGLGGAQPRASNAREATRRLNRRVEVRVTGGTR
ncbi:OmpA family protein [Hymenobacter chitinivorans]|uniref:OmpA family protein n=1 Tax=Hymenobacter chitinivorans DSM 11115 TaxID=1121954 RepID=A0A2M9BR79_9BACT|nr:OmpA family protein [Hymenobacter chitinivorans]PJJ60450.1 OmpA family protein [Hymenobacter chitinivorans DSM 11115]